MARDLARHLVALEHVLEGADLEAELVGQADAASGSRRRGSSGRALDLALEDVAQRLELAGRGAAATGRSPLAPAALSLRSYSSHSRL